MPCTTVAQDFAVTVYGGRVTMDIWSKSLTPGVEFADAYIMVGALSWTAHRFFNGAVSLELEGQVGKYFGDQDNWEEQVPMESVCLDKLCLWYRAIICYEGASTRRGHQ